MQIPAFGPFTDLDLEFRSDPADLHVIYGPNEAGKSSLLRAVRDLLFGIPGQSSDNFRHEYGKLRIKGEICNRAGDTLTLVRRKGIKNTLADGTGTELTEDALGRFLGAVDQDYFSAMFGLGARELHEGALQLLRGEGDMGHALFSASMGGTPVQQVLEGLRTQAERLYKGRASANVSIRPAVNSYRDLLRQSREAIVNAETWTTLEKELADAEAQLRSVTEQLSMLDQELAQVERCEAALPMVGRIADATQQLNQLPPLPEVASDFAARAQSARAALSKEQWEVQRLSERLAKVQSDLEKCQHSPALLAQADTLDRLHQDLGAYRDNKAEFDKRKSKLAALESILRTGMEKLGLSGNYESVAAYRLSTPARLECETAANCLRLAMADEANNARKIAELKEQIEDRESELQNLTETNLTQLREALTGAEGAIDADRTVAASQSEVRRLNRETLELHKQLAGAPEDLEATANLPVPALATVRQYQEQFEEIKREVKTHDTKTREGKTRTDHLQAELVRIQRQGQLPSEEALLKARQHRDHGWALVLAEWKQGEKGELDPGVPLELAFSKSIHDADQIADALRHQAEAVAQAEEKRLQLAEADKQLSDIRQTISDLQSTSLQRQKIWEAAWASCQIIPRSPSEMLEWRELWTAFKERLAKLRTAQETLEIKRGQIQQAKARLAAALREPEDKEFSLLFQQAKTQVQEAEERRGRRAEIVKQLSRWRTDLAKLDQSRTGLMAAVSSAAANWRSQCLAAALPEGTLPDAGLTLLRERNELLAKFGEWQELTNAQQLTAEKISVYEQAIAKNAGALGIAGDSTLFLESTLWKALTEARNWQVTRANLAEQTDHLAAELADAKLRLDQADQALQELLGLAQLSHPSELELFLAHLEQRHRFRDQISQLRSNLVGLARGPAVDEFIDQVRAVNPDELRQRQISAKAARLHCEAALSGIRETVFQLAARKRQLETAGDTAADLRQQAESVAAGLRDDAARYLRLRLAAHLLEIQIERFRKENQGPLLQKSGELFCAITQGAFSGLAAEFNADDVPVLVALRPDGTKVGAEGLSDGSRDQLYLALRLAALDRHLQEHEPMPLILDDLLITFDDDRAKAILPQLAALAKRTQIFLLTHHQHLVDLCGATLGETQFHLHRL